MAEDKVVIRRVFHADHASAIKALEKRYPEIGTMEVVPYEGSLKHRQVMVVIQGVKEDARILELREIPLVLTDDVASNPEMAEQINVIVNRLLTRESQKLAKIDVLSADIESFVDNMSSTKQATDITVAETKELIKTWYQTLADSQRDANGKRKKLAFTCNAIIDALQSSKKASIHFPDTAPEDLDRFIEKLYANIVASVFKEFNKPTTIIDKWYANRNAEAKASESAVSLDDIADLF